MSCTKEGREAMEGRGERQPIASIKGAGQQDLSCSFSRLGDTHGDVVKMRGLQLSSDPLVVARLKYGYQ
jgi:hypothetical protein